MTTDAERLQIAESRIADYLQEIIKTAQTAENDRAHICNLSCRLAWWIEQRDTLSRYAEQGAR